MVSVFLLSMLNEQWQLVLLFLCECDSVLLMVWFMMNWWFMIFIVWCMVRCIIGLLMWLIRCLNVLGVLVWVVLFICISLLVSIRFQVEVLISIELLLFRCFFQLVLVSLLWISLLVVFWFGMCSSVLVMYISSMFFLLFRLYWCMKVLIVFWFLVCMCMWLIRLVVSVCILVCFLVGRCVCVSSLCMWLVLFFNQVLVMVWWNGLGGVGSFGDSSVFGCGVLWVVGEEEGVFMLVWLVENLVILIIFVVFGSVLQIFL